MATETQTKLVGFCLGNKANYNATTYANHIWFDPTNKQILLNGIEYIPKKLSELVNDKNFLTSITKSMVENVLTGNITSHTHSYLPLADKGLSNGKVPYYVNFPSHTQLVRLGYNEESTMTDDEYYFKGLCKWAIDNYANQGNILLIGNANPNGVGYCCIQLYSSSGKDADTGLPRYCSGTYCSLKTITMNFHCYEYIWTWRGTFLGNAATATNADTLDGYHASSFLTTFSYKPIDLNEISTPTIYWLSTENPNLPDAIFKYGHILTVKDANADNAWQLIGSYSSDALWFRRGTWYANGTGTLRTNAWKVIAFTDSSITGNAATATKLQNLRTLWGNSFDGSGSVSGDLEFVVSGQTSQTSHGMRKGSSYGGFIGFSNIIGKTQPDGTISGAFTGISLGWGANPEDNDKSVRINANIFTYKSYPILHSNNFSDYAPTKTGGGASGTWGININGNAVTASSLNDTRLTDSDTLNSYIDGRFSYINAIDPAGAYSTNAVVLSFANRGYDVFQLAMAYNAYDKCLAFRRLGISSGSVVENTDWNPILTAANYNYYSPTLTGAGASGTWGINISGNAATATALTTSAGSATQPIYFSNGKPVACTYTLGKSVPSNAVFTDTTYSVATASADGLMSSAMFKAQMVKSVGVQQGAEMMKPDGTITITDHSVYITQDKSNINGVYQQASGENDVKIPNATKDYDGSMSYTDKKKLDKMPNTVFGLRLDIDDASTATYSDPFGDYKIGYEDATREDVNTIQTNNHYITLIAFNITNDELKNKLQNRFVKFGYSSKDSATYQTMRLLQSNFDGGYLFVEYIHTEPQYNVSFDCIWELY